VGRLEGVRKRPLARRGRHLHELWLCGFFHTSKQPEADVAVLHNDVLPFYTSYGLEADADRQRHGVLRCGGATLRDLSGAQRHPAPPYEFQRFAERFNRTVQEVFFRVKFHENVSSLQKELDEWVLLCNYELPHLGYRN